MPLGAIAGIGRVDVSSSLEAMGVFRDSAGCEAGIWGEDGMVA
jgi:hypothetical protein